jgi:hypothetical protein
MELDIFIPSLSLAFEYQGQQHFKDNLIIGSSKVLQMRDKEKEMACQQKGITLIPVIYTWKKDKESIIKMICTIRPDLEQMLKT